MVLAYQLPNKWQRLSVCITEKKCLKEGQYKKNSSSVLTSQKDPGFQKRFNFIGVCQHVLYHQGCKILLANLKYMPQKKGGKLALRKEFEMRNCIINCRLKLKDLKHISLSISF